MNALRRLYLRCLLAIELVRAAFALEPYLAIATADRALLSGPLF